MPLYLGYIQFGPTNNLVYDVDMFSIVETVENHFERRVKKGGDVSYVLVALPAVGSALGGLDKLWQS